MEYERPKPVVVKVAAGFCILNGILNLLLIALPFVLNPMVPDMINSDPTMSQSSPEEKTQLIKYLQQMMFAYAFVGLIFAPLNFWLAFAKPKPGFYVAHAVNLGLGVLSCVCAPIALPALIFWFKPDVREYFNFR